MGTGVKGGVNPPVLSALLGQQKVGGGVPFPSPYKPQVPPAMPGQLWSAGLFMLTLFSPQFKRARSPSSRSGPSLNLPSLELPAGQLRQLRRWIRAGFT